MGMASAGCALLSVSVAMVGPLVRPAPAPATPVGLARARASRMAKQDEGPYRASVLLPQTSFSQRANAKTREPELQRLWEETGVYERLSRSNPGERYTLHDGPPYANGDLHIGHALNKILKDVINRYQLLRGRRARYVPGWDCHGLPIELKVLQTMKSKERAALTPLTLRAKAAQFARETVDAQRESFRRYGVWGDWDEPYLTLQPEYEAAQIGVFGRMVLNGHIYRGRKPVHWSPSSRTALAEAELEYPEGHTSTSIYVSFGVTHAPDALADAGGPPLRVAVWTTTPWTIPANLAVAVNERLEYSLVSHPSLDSTLVVATELVGALSAKLKLPDADGLKVVRTLRGKDLAGMRYAHPLYDRESEVVIGGEYITTESGTGLVHTAPGHGVEDYQTGLKHNLELLSPVNDAGKFTAEAGEAFAGMSVLGEGNEAVIKALEEAGALLLAEPYEHKCGMDTSTLPPTRRVPSWARMHPARAAEPPPRLAGTRTTGAPRSRPSSVPRLNGSHRSMGSATPRSRRSTRCSGCLRSGVTGSPR